MPISLLLASQQEPDKARLALNTYCRPFLVPPHFIGIWCPEGRNIRLACFDPDQLKAFDLAEVAGWFKPSADRIYSATAPMADFEVPLTLGPGTHRIEVPAELAIVDELIVPTSYKAMSNDDPAFALLVFLPAGGVGGGSAAEMVYRRAISCGATVDYASSARSGVATHHRRMLWSGNVSA